MSGQNVSIVTKDAHGVAAQLLKDLSVMDLIAAQAWLESLLQLRTARMSVLKKLQATLSATFAAKTIWPLIRVMGRKTRQYGWVNRGRSARFGLTVAGVALAVFGGQSAGIAALGSAVAVPLWVVFGAGAAFASTMLDELGRELNGKAVSRRGAGSDPFDGIEEAEVVDVAAG